MKLHIMKYIVDYMNSIEVKNTLVKKIDEGK